MDRPEIYRITNYMNENAADAFVVAGILSGLNASRAVGFIAGYASRYTDGAVHLSNSDVSELLVEFYGFHEVAETADATEVDISMTLKDYSFMGRWEPEFELLLDDPLLKRDEVLKRIETLCERTFEEACS